MRHHGFSAPSWDDLRAAIDQQRASQIDEITHQLDALPDTIDIDHQMGLLACKFASDPKEALQ